jgi:tetratricopeptide (TPR) repeat protein
MPDDLTAQLSLGLAHLAAKRWSDAEQVFRHFADRWPADPRGPQLLGDCYLAQGLVEEAMSAGREALARQPDFGPAHLVLGTALFTANDATAAEPHLRRAAETLPNSFAALVNFGLCLNQLRRGLEALDYFKKALKYAPDDVGLNVNIGLTLIGCYNYREAEHWFVKALRLDPDYVAALSGLGVVLRETQRQEGAIARYERALHLDPTCDAYRGLVDALWDLGRVAQAEQVAREACTRRPDDAEARSRLGRALVATGDFAGAEAAFEDALRIDAYHSSALTELARLLGSRLPAARREAMHEALRRPASVEALAGLHLAVAQVEDERGNFALAADHLRQGNAWSKKFWASIGRPYDAKAVSAQVCELLAAFGPTCFQRTAGLGDPTDQPVFVIGMQRSGTTLVEQILASHSRVFGAGESGVVSQSLLRLPSVMKLNVGSVECVGRMTREAAQDSASWCLDKLRQRLDGPADRIVDKTPNNYLFLGWLHILFPKAKFIHCRRDLRDVALSCWMTHFSMLRWANDLDHIASQIRDYRKVMDHWRQNLPVPILDIDYERLVSDQEGESRRLIEWLGLEWDPACLEYHRTKRPVQTSSVTQVRKPMYSRSIWRWRHYVDTLRPLIVELGLGFD